MKYTIKYDDELEVYWMGIFGEKFIGRHLESIARENKISLACFSESHLLHIIQSHGIVVELLDSDGKNLVW